jgi:two-component system phosphate regulon response regulator PhoB
MTSAHTRILIVEDEPAIVELVKFSLREEGWNCFAVSNAKQAWEFIQCSRPHLILLDWMLPEPSGLHLLLRIRRERSLNDLPIIMLSAKNLEQDKLDGLGSGADDYVTKPFSPRELCARAKALLRRTYLAPEALTIQVANVVLDPLSCTVRIDEARIAITHAEYRLLQLLMSHPGKVFSRHELRDKLSNVGDMIDERSVDVNVLRLRKAMREARSLIKTVRHIGYMLEA